MRIVLRIIAHALVFLAAVVVFYLGLGIGLALNPAAGTALWLVAGALGLGNLWWIISSANKRRKPQST